MRIDWKSNLRGVARYPAECKLLGEGEPAGTFEAYVAIFGTPDRPDFFGDSDIIEPGAFTQALQEKGLPPVVWSHVWTIPPVGQALQAVEDAKGLRIKARLFLDDDGISGQYARSIHTGMTATPPVVREFSFAFEAKEWSDEKVQTGQFIRHLKRLELFEVGPVLVGRHPDTELIGAKSQPLVVAPAALDRQAIARSLNTKSPAHLRARWDAALKAGARNANADLGRLNDIHDQAGEIQTLAVANGAER
ncbi:MAG: HK97 family phage prohead protease [Chloroflexi bacterium]|nr:HK97 family phage prohead protease [Chloroflexota bacterium]